MPHPTIYLQNDTEHDFVIITADKQVLFSVEKGKPYLHTTTNPYNSTINYFKGKGYVEITREKMQARIESSMPIIKQYVLSVLT